MGKRLLLVAAVLMLAAVVGQAGEEPKTAPYLGVSLGEKDGQVVVVEVVAGSPAEKAGLKAADVITAFDGVAVKTAVELKDAVAKKKAGDEVAIEILRGGEKQTVKATLAERPAEK